MTAPNSSPGVGEAVSSPTVSVESIAKIIRRSMQDHSIPATQRSERAAREVAERMGASLKRAIETDPMEAHTAAALTAAGLKFITDHEPDSPARLDFYLPASDVHIEVKRFHSERVAGQLQRANDLILLQGAGAVAFFAKHLAALSRPQPVKPRREADVLATLLDNVVIAQSLSRELRQAAIDEARSYLYNRRQRLAQDHSAFRADALHPTEREDGPGVGWEPVAAFLKERDEALEPGEADDNERQESARCILDIIRKEPDHV